MHILVTGGCGFIGSHTVVELQKAGHTVTIIDDLSNAKETVLDRIKTITGIRPDFFKADVRDSYLLRAAFQKRPVDAVIHFAGLKAVGESVQKPLLYYEVNIGSALTLLRVMQEAGVKRLVFSSSATVYGDPVAVPITEEMPLGITTNPYGTTKAMQERIFSDVAKADDEWHILLLRYFNPIGAHESGLIGEDPQGIPNNLLPYVAQVATGKLSEVHIFGDDYDTPDGTGVRDYIHVVDLADGHVKAVEHLANLPGANAVNLGTGTGYSVKEVVAAFSAACGKELPVVIEGRRAGDIACCYADPSKAERLLHWKATRDLQTMCADSWRWQSQNPDGYPEV